MSRYVFYCGGAVDDKVLAAARKAARLHGATVLKSLAGTMLLEMSLTRLPEVVQALPGWHYTAERKTTRLPERRPAERASSHRKHT